MQPTTPASGETFSPPPHIDRSLIQAVYRSRCLTGPDGETEILSASRRNNPARGITGVLISHGGWFIQVLEGPVLEINRLLEAIRCDNRNGEFMLLRVSSLAERDFAEWSMASTQVNAEHFLQLLEGLMLDWPPCKKMLQEFVLEGRWREDLTGAAPLPVNGASAA